MQRHLRPKYKKRSMQCIGRLNCKHHAVSRISGFAGHPESTAIQKTIALRTAHRKCDSWTDLIPPNQAGLTPQPPSATSPFTCAGRVKALWAKLLMNHCTSIINLYEIYSSLAHAQKAVNAFGKISAKTDSFRRRKTEKRLFFMRLHDRIKCKREFNLHNEVFL